MEGCGRGEVLGYGEEVECVVARRGEVGFLEGVWEVAACGEEVGSIWRRR